MRLEAWNTSLGTRLVHNRTSTISTDGYSSNAVVPARCRYSTVRGTGTASGLLQTPSWSCPAPSWSTYLVTRRGEHRPTVCRFFVCLLWVSGLPCRKIKKMATRMGGQEAQYVYSGDHVGDAESEVVHLANGDSFQGDMREGRPHGRGMSCVCRRCKPTLQPPDSLGQNA